MPGIRALVFHTLKRAARQVTFSVKLSPFVQGLPQGVEFKGARWLFNNEENAEEFKASPEKYAPSYLGIVLSAPTGKNIGQLRDGFEVRQIQSCKRNLPFRIFTSDSPLCGLTFRAAPAGECYIGTFVGQGTGGFETDPRIGTGHDGDPIALIGNVLVVHFMLELCFCGG